jgi:hypothetical protein
MSANETAKNVQVHPYFDEGYVQLDRHTGVLRRFDAVARPEAGVEVRLEIETDDNGRPHCRKLTVSGENVTSELLRAVPVARYMAEAMQVPLVYFRVGEGRIEPPTARERADFYRRYVKGAPPPQPGAPITDDRPDFYQRYVMSARRPQRGTPITDEQLQTVADLYRAAEQRGDPPVKTIVEQLEVTRGTAQRWVNKARERKLLEPSPRREGR